MHRGSFHFITHFVRKVSASCTHDTLSFETHAEPTRMLAKWFFEIGSTRWWWCLTFCHSWAKNRDDHSRDNIGSRFTSDKCWTSCRNEHEFWLVEQRWLRSLTVGSRYCYTSFHSIRNDLFDCISRCARYIFVNISNRALIIIEFIKMKTRLKSCLFQFFIPLNFQLVTF